MQKWEYDIYHTLSLVSDPFMEGRERTRTEEDLELLGNEGWELVSVTYREPDEPHEAGGYTLIFKRPVV